MQRIWENIC